MGNTCCPPANETILDRLKEMRQRVAEEEPFKSMNPVHRVHIELAITEAEELVSARLVRDTSIEVARIAGLPKTYLVEGLLPADEAMVG